MRYFMSDIKQNFIYCQLMQIKKYPWFFLEKKSLRYLECHIKAYILGYLCEKKEAEVEWFKEFERYVCDICVDGKGTYGAVSAILKCGYDDEEGFDYYYELLESFFKEKGIGENYEQNIKESYLKDEIKILRIPEEKIYQMAGKYIAEHMEELFDLPEKRTDFITENRLELLFEEGEIISVLYDSQYTNLNEVKNKLKLLKK